MEQDEKKCYNYFFTNFITSFGVQLRMSHNFSSVRSVILLPFFNESKVLLSMPDCKSLYCDISFCFIVAQRGL